LNFVDDIGIPAESDLSSSEIQSTPRRQIAIRPKITEYPIFAAFPDVQVWNGFPFPKMPVFQVISTGQYLRDRQEKQSSHEERNTKQEIEETQRFVERTKGKPSTIRAPYQYKDGYGVAPFID
jgi:hypothetical protein